MDRITISGVKTYKYTEDHCDLMIGVSRNDFDLYLFPIRFAYLYKTSVSLKKIGMVRNNWNILLNWNDDYLAALENSLVK